MRRTSAYFISLLLFFQLLLLHAQDTVLFPLRSGPGSTLRVRQLIFITMITLPWKDIFHSTIMKNCRYVLEGGYLNYKYSQYNYDYLSKGVFTRAGVDFNFLKPEISKGKYWTGIGLRYGLSVFNSETPMFQHENYWGSVTSSIPSDKYKGHFIEVVSGVRTELFRNFSMGWTIRMKLLLSGGGGKDLKPYLSLVMVMAEKNAGPVSVTSFHGISHTKPKQ